MYRVWTKNFDGSVTCMMDWSSRRECKDFILGRWGHHPPFAFISKAANEKEFRRYNGD